MAHPIKPWSGAIILPILGGTVSLTKQRSVVLTNSDIVGSVSWTVNLISYADAVDGAYLFFSDWDAAGTTTLVADKPINVPKLGTATSQTLKTGTIMGLVYVADAAMWLPINYYDPSL